MVSNLNRGAPLQSILFDTLDLAESMVSSNDWVYIKFKMQLSDDGSWTLAVDVADEQCSTNTIMQNCQGTLWLGEYLGNGCEVIDNLTAVEI